MKKLLEHAFVNVKTLNDIRDEAFGLFKQIKKRQKDKRIGYVAGLITSDGPSHIQENLQILTEYTEKLREHLDFPIFSSIDLVSSETFSRIQGETISADEWVHFFREILQSSYVTDIFMAPSWERSRGAKDEHDTAKTLGISIHYAKE